MHKAIYLPLPVYTTLYYENKHRVPFYIQNIHKNAQFYSKCYGRNTTMRIFVINKLSNF